MREIAVETTVPPIAIQQGRPAVLGSRHMVSSTHYLSSLAGLRMFPRGGNAIDAGVAAGIALNVIERHLTDFGGVAPIMVMTSGMREPETIDGLGRWPAGLDLTAYRARFGDDMPVGIPRSVTPAAADAWLTALARHGRLTLADVLAPAIELCEGFPVYPRLASAIERLAGRLREWPTSAAVFLPEGRPPRVGELLVQRELGDLFRRLLSVESAHSTRGRAAAIMAARDAIYHGDIAREIAAFMAREGGALTAEDLAEYRVTIGPAVRSTYRGLDVYACGPWSQGPLVPMTLNLLEGYDVAGMGPGSLEFLHTYTEAMKLACADREGFFGDPDLVDVPIRGLLDPAYAAERRALIRADRAWPELPPPGDPWRHEGRTGPAGYRPPVAEGVGAPDTSYVCAMDAEGNAFSATPSDPGLGAPLVPGLGMIVSTRGAQLWTVPGHPSAIAPRKRPRLTPNPALVARGGRAIMPFGCPGEDAQCQAMVQVLCNVVDFGMNVQQAIEAPRVISRSFPWSFHPHAYRPGELQVEGRVARAVRDGLERLGHRVMDMPDYTPAAAGVCAIRLLETGALEGGADPRRESYAVGW
ncbi:MAG TPA: gamma-glutamyltransferase family protein [Candidatus Limnocylindrales bacterium]|nr:gamma-glutamyltransferase family protein [Candidatus Limnocylindrales bacterium]